MTQRVDALRDDELGSHEEAPGEDIVELLGFPDVAAVLRQNSGYRRDNARSVRTP